MKRLLGSSLLALVIVTHAHAAPRAPVQYVWEVWLEELYGDEIFSVCHDNPQFPEKTYYRRSYYECLQNISESRDNALSKKWGLTDKVIRENDTIYINVPTRNLPLTLRENHSPLVSRDGLNYYLSLETYDAENEVLTIKKQMWNATNTIAVNLTSGIDQVFIGTQLKLSPNGDYAITVDQSHGGEDVDQSYEEHIDQSYGDDIVLWQRKSDGLYYSEDIDSDLKKAYLLEQSMAHYNDEGYHVQVRPQWVTDNSLIIDYHFETIGNDKDNYDVRFNYVKSNLEDDWKIIPIR